MNDNLKFKIGGEKLIDVLGYDKLFQLIVSGVRFDYVSYDHKKAMSEYNESDEFADYRLSYRNPKSWDIPDSLKDKYRVIRKGKLRSIQFNPVGKVWRFSIGSKFSKTYSINDFGVKVIPYIDIDEHPLDFAKFLTLDNSNQTGSLKQHIFVPKIKRNILGDEYYGNQSLCGSIQVHDGDKSVDIRDEFSDVYDSKNICSKCIKSFNILKESYIDFSFLGSNY
jgi:hypothetical protein